MSCGWESNRRSSVALAMCHRLQWFIRLHVQIAAATLSGNSIRQTVNTNRACLASSEIGTGLRAGKVTAGLAESNSNLPPGLWLTSPAGWLPRTGISSGTPYARQSSMGYLYLYLYRYTAFSLFIFMSDVVEDGCVARRRWSSGADRTDMRRLTTQPTAATAK